MNKNNHSTSNLHSECSSINQVLAVLFYLQNSKLVNNIYICSVHLQRHKNEVELAKNMAELWILLILKTLEENVTERWVLFPSHCNNTNNQKSESTGRHFTEPKCHQSHFFHVPNWVIYMSHCLDKIKSERYRAKREHKYRGSGIFILRKSQKTAFSTFLFFKSICATFRAKCIVHKATLNSDTSKAPR